MVTQMLRNVGAEHADRIVECFAGIKTEPLHRVIEKRDLSIPETVIITYVLMTWKQREILIL